MRERILRWSALDARFEGHDTQNRLKFYLCVPSDCPSDQIAADIFFPHG